MNTKHQIGDKVEILVQGEKVMAEVVGRDWCFDILVSYHLRTENGKYFTQNVKTEDIGHSH